MKLITAALAAGLLIAGSAVTLHAEEGNRPGASDHEKREWAKKHPRRHQVNKRLKNQDRRIHQEVKEGEMSKGQAADLHKDDRQIRHEERDMASQDGGHITKQDQRTLNQQENQTSREIGK